MEELSAGSSLAWRDNRETGGGGTKGERERERDRDRDRDREGSCRRRSKMHDRAREAAMELEDTVLVEVWVRLESGQGKWSFPRLERKQKNGV